jgi:CDP-diacylglycerol---glycerol-3-phosphate 3-phosphatidyltransferase
MWFMVAISLISAFDYFAAFWKKIDHRATKRRRRPFVLSRKKRRQRDEEANAAGQQP